MAGEPHDRPGAVAAAPATAGKNGPNHQNAKLCQQGGWEDLYTSTGAEFGSERECTGRRQGRNPAHGAAACRTVRVHGFSVPPYACVPRPRLCDAHKFILLRRVRHLPAVAMFSSTRFRSRTFSRNRLRASARASVAFDVPYRYPWVHAMFAIGSCRSAFRWRASRSVSIANHLRRTTTCWEFFPHQGQPNRTPADVSPVRLGRRRRRQRRAPPARRQSRARRWVPR